MNKDVMKEYAELKKDVERINNRLRELATMGTDNLKELGETITEDVTEKVETGMKIAKEKSKEVDEFVSDNPWLVVGVVSVISLIVGHILGGSSKNRHS